MNEPRPRAAEATNPFQPPAAAIEPLAEQATDPTGLRAEPARVPASRGAKWIGEGWTLFTISPLAWVGMLVTLGVIFMGAGMLPIIGILSSWLFVPFMAGWMRACHRAHVDSAVRYEDLFAGFSESSRGPLAIAGLVYLGLNLALMVGMVLLVAGMMSMVTTIAPEDGLSTFMYAALLGFLVAMALYVPLMMLIWFVPVLILLHRVSPLAAMKASFIACLRNLPAFLVYGLIGLLWIILGALPLLLGWLVVYPLLMCAMYASYRDIFLAPEAHSSDDPAQAA